MKSKRNEQVFVLRQSELELFEKLDAEDYIDLYYADGSHFSLTPNVRYAWQKKGEEILLPSSRSVALSVFGIISRDCRLYSEMFDGFKNFEV